MNLCYRCIEKFESIGHRVEYTPILGKKPRCDSCGKEASNAAIVYNEKGGKLAEPKRISTDRPL